MTAVSSAAVGAIFGSSGADAMQVSKSSEPSRVDPVRESRIKNRRRQTPALANPSSPASNAPSQRTMPVARDALSLEATSSPTRRMLSGTTMPPTERMPK